MIKKYISLHLTVILIVLLVIIGAIYFIRRDTTESTNMSVSETRLSEIKEMIRLCTLEVRDDIAFKDSINGKWIFARNTVNGYIRFNLEDLTYETRNDSVFVILPREEIEIYESTADNAYEVIDTWDNSLLGLGKMTAAEETAIKKRMAERYRLSFYDKGYVSRARQSAVNTLNSLLGMMDGNIRVIDPSPSGYR